MDYCEFLYLSSHEIKMGQLAKAKIYYREINLNNATEYYNNSLGSWCSLW